MADKVMADKVIASAKVHFIAGKGGVGKTLISRALAQVFAKKHKTLLIEMCEEDAGVFEAPPLTVEGRLSHITIFPDQTLYEYLLIKIPQKKVLDSFLSQSLIRALSSAMPGLKDLTRLGKIWFHADEKHSIKPDEIFDKIVVDMPSSGFVGRFLTIASVVENVVKVGPLAKEAALIKSYFRDAHNALLHVVSVPSELVVNETVELIDTITGQKSIHLGILFINRVFSPKGLSKDSLPIDASLPELKKITEFLQNRLKEGAIQLKRLQTASDLPCLPFADQMGELKDEVIIHDMAITIERALA
jgi:hypothetical protein